MMMTFDVMVQNPYETSTRDYYPNQTWNYELACLCRSCHRLTIFEVQPNESFRNSHFLTGRLDKFNEDISEHTEIIGYISIKDMGSISPPEHLPENLRNVFNEGATCLAVGCYNAAATMFRLCVDLVTIQLLPTNDSDEPQPNSKQRRDLGLRLPWLFDNSKLPDGLRALASCIKEDGNDGAHQGNLTKNDCEDLMEFTFALLERLETEPAKLKLAQERREKRRNPN